MFQPPPIVIRLVTRRLAFPSPNTFLASDHARDERVGDAVERQPGGREQRLDGREALS
jgi:hypothetical protein